jgi:hypothetical protein
MLLLALQAACTLPQRKPALDITRVRSRTLYPGYHLDPDTKHKLFKLGLLAAGAPNLLKEQLQAIGRTAPADLFGLSTRRDCVLEITKLTPNSTRGRLSRDVVIEFSPQNLSIVRCRFGRHVVFARKHRPGSIVCQAPPLPAGSVHVMISEGGSTFCGDALFTFEKRMLPVSYIWAACAVGLAAAAVVLWATRKTGPQIRKNIIPRASRGRRGGDAANRKQPAAFL